MCTRAFTQNNLQALFVFAFGSTYNPKMLAPSQAPVTMQDFLKPELKGKIVTAYPNDDDAVLFMFKKAVDQHGWDYVHQFKTQNGYYVRGTQAPFDDVAAGKAVASFATGDALVPYEGATALTVIPKDGPITAWPQYGAIFKDAKNPAAAKLFFNWLLSKEFQSQWYQFPVRTDVAAPKGLKHLWDYKNYDVNEFEKFMSNREAVELFRQKITMILGEVKGDSSAGYPGLTPSKAISVP
ncbi:MAG: ABC transporter substrate-binding protein [Formosimonas sp.]